MALAVAGDYRLGFHSLDRQTDIASSPVSGSLPTWLEGTLLRNGPAKFSVGTDRYRHRFDGLAMIHRFTIAAGTVSYAPSSRITAGSRVAERASTWYRKDGGALAGTYETDAFFAFHYINAYDDGDAVVLDTCA